MSSIPPVIHQQVSFIEQPRPPVPEPLALGSGLIRLCGTGYCKGLTDTSSMARGLGTRHVNCVKMPIPQRRLKPLSKPEKDYVLHPTPGTHSTQAVIVNHSPFPSAPF